MRPSSDLYTPARAKSEKGESGAVPREREKIYETFRHLRPTRIEAQSAVDGDIEKYSAGGRIFLSGDLLPC
jgi:hypothetical protein